MLTTNEFYKKEIINYYSWIETIVKNNNSFGFTDINISLESLICQLLKILNLGDYTNCNRISICYPTIDLFDQKGKTGIQITSDCSATKIKNTLLDTKNKEYKIKFFFLNSNYKPTKYTINKYLNFDENDILNFKKSLVIAENSGKLEQLYDFFKANIILPIDTQKLSLINGYNVYEQNFFLDKMMNICNRFVPTSITNKCLKHIENNNLLILTGNPGVGKTYNSYFITAKLIEKGYKLLYSSNNNLKDILEKYNDKDNFVLFIDDIFGSNDNGIFKSNLSEEEIVSLFENKKSNLKVIVNSRCSIFEDVNNQSDKIARLKLKTFVIEVTDFTSLEKARILVKHLECNKVSKEKIKQLFEKNENYFNDYPSNQKIYEILFHKNYNPRSIDIATKDISEEIDDFFNYILKVLNDPFLIYEHAYSNNLDNIDHEILRIIYLKSSSFFNNILVDEIFKFANELNINENEVRLSLRKLEKSFICQYRDKNGKNVCKFYNPSVLDFCFKIFESSHDMCKYIDLIKNPDDLTNLIKNPKIDSSKKIKKIQELNYNDYSVIKNINNDDIKKDSDFLNYLHNDIFENHQIYKYNMDCYCSDNYIDDANLLNRLEKSKNIRKFISFSYGTPSYIITERIFKLINKISNEKKEEIFSAIAEELKNEIVSYTEDYILQNEDINECESYILEVQYNEIKNNICDEFKEYVKDNNINIKIPELDNIFNSIEKYNFSDYEEIIDSKFNKNEETSELNSDDLETIAFLREYSESL